MAIVHGLPLLVVFVSMAQLDGSVTIIQDDVDDGHDFTECGEKLVLTCTIDNYLSSSTMTWQNENSSTILVSCSGSTCNLNPSVINVYNKSEDTNTGTFNLIIPTVTRDISGISYLCENGFVRDSIVVEVQDYRPILNESSSTELTVRSGCIDESVDVEFKWKKIKASDSSKTDDYDPTYINTDETIDKTFCTLDTACGFSNSVTQERSIKTERGDENDYYLKAVIFYNGVPMESVQTTYAYKIEGVCDVDVKCIIFQIISFVSLLVHYARGIKYGMMLHKQNQIDSYLLIDALSYAPSLCFFVFHFIIGDKCDSANLCVIKDITKALKCSLIFHFVITYSIAIVIICIKVYKESKFAEFACIKVIWFYCVLLNILYVAYKFGCFLSDKINKENANKDEIEFTHMCCVRVSSEVTMDVTHAHVLASKKTVKTPKVGNDAPAPATEMNTQLGTEEGNKITKSPLPPIETGKRK